jgi:hypothetical protein
MSESAFPMAIPANCHRWEDGMTLRDYFAGQALVGLLATGEDYHDNNYGDGWNWFAAAAYNLADAMIEAREQSK